MKKLIFIDNDWESDAKDELYYTKQNLKTYSDLDSDYIKSIEPMYRIVDKSRDDMYKLLFDSKHAIITYSMFTGTHHGSLYQLFGFLSAAGRNSIKNQVYIDCACYLHSTLNRNLTDQKYPLDVAVGIESNYIIGKGNEGKFFRMRVDLTDRYNLIKEEPIESLNALLL